MTGNAAQPATQLASLEQHPYNPAMTTHKGKVVWWPDNVDSKGWHTFLLPGETTIDSATIRARTSEFYAQTRGPEFAKIRSKDAGFRALQQARESLELSRYRPPDQANK